MNQCQCHISKICIGGTSGKKFPKSERWVRWHCFEQMAQILLRMFLTLSQEWPAICRRGFQIILLFQKLSFICLREMCHESQHLILWYANLPLYVSHFTKCHNHICTKWHFSHDQDKIVGMMSVRVAIYTTCLISVLWAWFICNKISSWTFWSNLI